MAKNRQGGTKWKMSDKTQGPGSARGPGGENSCRDKALKEGEGSTPLFPRALGGHPVLRNRQVLVKLVAENHLREKASPSQPGSRADPKKVLNSGGRKKGGARGRHSFLTSKKLWQKTRQNETKTEQFGGAGRPSP